MLRCDFSPFFVEEWAKITLLLLWTMSFSSFHRCSFGLRSVDWLGHSRSFIFLFWNQWRVSLAVFGIIHPYFIFIILAAEFCWFFFLHFQTMKFPPPLVECVFWGDLQWRGGYYVIQGVPFWFHLTSWYSPSISQACVPAMVVECVTYCLLWNIRACWGLSVALPRWSLDNSDN